MRRWLIAAFLTMGLSFTVLQALMIRELLVSFSGNELSIGLILGAWLVLEALGSGWAGRLARRIPPHPAGYAWLQVTLALLLLPSLLLAMHVRGLVGAVPGEMIGPGPALLGALLVLAPIGLVDGAMFTAACRVRLRLGAPEGALPAGRVYVLEATGGIAGGIAFTYLLLPAFSSTQILLLVAALNLASALPLFLLSPRRSLPGAALSALLALLALAALLSPLGATLHHTAVAGRWSPYHLAYEANSVYGNVAVIEEAGQVTLFSNGTPVLTAPDPDVATVEHLVHLPILFLEAAPRHVLVIGGGAGGVLHELQRYPLERVDYAELDPQLIEALQAAPTPLTMEELADPRLAITLEDGRRFVRRHLLACAGQMGDPACPRYDLVLVNLPFPSTLLLNRLYTEEFFEQVRPLLAPGGLFVLPAPPARTYMSPAARDLLGCYGRTLEAVFAQVRAIPGDDLTLWLASPARPLDLDAATLIGRWASRTPETRLLQRDYLAYLLDAGVGASFVQGLGAAGDVERNRDRYPAGLRYGLAYEGALFAPAIASFYRALGELRWYHLAIGIALLTLAGLLLVRRRRTLVPIAIATTGLAGMGADLLVILAFQVRYGYVYQQVGLLITAFMAGLSLGGWLMTTRVGRLKAPWRALVGVEVAVTAAGAGLAGLLLVLLGRPIPTSPLEHALLLLANVVAGALVGLEYPLANRILSDGGKRGAGLAGSLYAWDLVGATVGAVALSAVLLPALGLFQAALVVVLCKVGSLILAAVRG